MMFWLIYVQVTLCTRKPLGVHFAWTFADERAICQAMELMAKQIHANVFKMDNFHSNLQIQLKIKDGFLWFNYKRYVNLKYFYFCKPDFKKPFEDRFTDYKIRVTIWIYLFRDEAYPVFRIKSMNYRWFLTRGELMFYPRIVLKLLKKTYKLRCQEKCTASLR